MGNSTAFKEHGINISLSTVATLIPVLTVLWFIIKPALLLSITVAVADDIRVQVSTQVAPMQNAFKTIIKSNMDKSKRAIAKLEYKERHNRVAWTSDDSDLLTDLVIELQALEEAYKAL